MDQTFRFSFQRLQEYGHKHLHAAVQVLQAFKICNSTNVFAKEQTNKKREQRLVWKAQDFDDTPLYHHLTAIFLAKCRPTGNSGCYCVTITWPVLCPMDPTLCFTPFNGHFFLKAKRPTSKVTPGQHPLEVTWLVFNCEWMQGGPARKLILLLPRWRWVASTGWWFLS